MSRSATTGTPDRQYTDSESQVQRDPDGVLAPFVVQANCPMTAARTGLLRTNHGLVETPVFMPVGTQGTVKGLTPGDLESAHAQVILGNTYHLWLRPGADLVARAGGLHRFMAWNRAILTDSGGFQVLSLAHLAEINEDGALFHSHLDGSPNLLTPEVSMAVQAALGSDIAMVLDVCPPHQGAPTEILAATERTTRWAARSVAAPHAAGQLVFGIVQGGTDPAWRYRSAADLVAMGFAGYGIGGLSVGEERTATWPALEASISALPLDRPRYLMGVGEPDDLLEAVARGVDMFDCVLPTRLGRNGTAMTSTGRVDLRRSAFADQNRPLEPGCDCEACSRFSLGYLHHLVRSGEELGLRLVSLHNIRFLVRLLEQARLAIEERRFPAYRETTLATWTAPNRAEGQEQRKRWRQQRGHSAS